MHQLLSWAFTQRGVRHKGWQADACHTSDSEQGKCERDAAIDGERREDELQILTRVMQILLADIVNQTITRRM